MGSNKWGYNLMHIRTRRLITPLIATHEPPSIRVTSRSGIGAFSFRALAFESSGFWTL